MHNLEEKKTHNIDWLSDHKLGNPELLLAVPREAIFSKSAVTSPKKSSLLGKRRPPSLGSSFQTRDIGDLGSMQTTGDTTCS